MVIKICKASGSFRSALDYNESKVSKGVAELVLAEGLDRTGEGDIGSVLQRLENGSKAASNLCFHMSINPSSTDSCNEGQVLELIRQAMAELGYGSQPYAVFHHHDIERRHYHVVSVRCDEAGNRIDSWHDRRKLQGLMRRLGPELGFTLGGPSCGKGSLDLSAEEADALVRKCRKDMVRTKPRRRFRHDGDLMPQIRSIIKCALGYDFISESEFKMVLKDYGLDLSMDNSRRTYTVSGTDMKGKKTTRPFTQDEIGIDLYSAIAAAVVYGRQARKAANNPKRDRLYHRLSACRRKTRSLCALKGMLASEGVSVRVSRKKGIVSGVSLIDHNTHSVFPGSSVWFSPNAAEGLRHYDSTRLKPDAVTALESAASELLALSFSGPGGGSAGSAGNCDDERKRKEAAFTAMLVDNNIAVQNVAVSNTAAI